MGCQKRIAEKIIKKGGNYCLALKKNQEYLYRDVVKKFEKASYRDTTAVYETCDKEHGRIEKRKCQIVDDLFWLKENHPFKGLKSIIRIDSERIIKKKSSTETRYYISSLQPFSQKMLQTIRSHWAIENKLHWVLDMSFNEDQSRIREGNGAENMAVIRHIALNLIRSARKKGASIKGLRKKAAWDEKVLERILLQKIGVSSTVQGTSS